MDVTLAQSILDSIKKLLGIDANYIEFDPDIVMFINTAIMALHQIGIGPEGYAIHDRTNTWSELLGEDETKLEATKTYIYLRVRLLFDPPVNSAILSAMKESLNEYEWRLNVAVDPERE